MILRRALGVARAAALPLTIGVGAASAEGLSTGQDRPLVNTNSNVTDGDNFLIGGRIQRVQQDQEGDEFVLASSRKR